MGVHIGKEIRRVIEEKGITGSWLAEQIGTSQRNLYALLNRPEISTKQLELISKALGYDFFKVFTPIKSPVAKVNESENDYLRFKTVLVTVELDGQEHTLKEWVKKLTAINQII